MTDKWWLISNSDMRDIQAAAIEIMRVARPRDDGLSVNLEDIQAIASCILYTLETGLMDTDALPLDFVGDDYERPAEDHQPHLQDDGR